MAYKTINRKPVDHKLIAAVHGLIDTYGPEALIAEIVNDLTVRLRVVTKEGNAIDALREAAWLSQLASLATGPER